MQQYKSAEDIRKLIRDKNAEDEAKYPRTDRYMAALYTNEIIEAYAKAVMKDSLTNSGWFDTWLCSSRITSVSEDMKTRIIDNLIDLGFKVKNTKDTESFLIRA